MAADPLFLALEPGPLQNHLLRRSYRVELLRPVNEPRVLQRTRLQAHLWEGGHMPIVVVTWSLPSRQRMSSMRHANGEPLVLVERYGPMLLDPDLLAGIKGADGWEAPHPLGHAYGELLVHETARNMWWFPEADPIPCTQPLGGGRHRVVVTGETAIDPLTLTDGRAMETGTHVVWASAQLLGVGRRARVTRSDDATRGAGPDVGFGSVRGGVRPHLHRR
ncbi:hypothetical protein ACIRP7_08525 [Streptomyces sp. NPDC102270]|uniref:hypothetical protein n=1 Tax=Streptomyces sp. NPDC102270 TaxID=3366150 RepID=UPI0038029247